MRKRSIKLVLHLFNRSVNAGLLRVECSEGLKFPDDYGPAYMILNGGTLRTTTMQAFARRGASITVGGGVLQVERRRLETGGDFCQR